MSLTDEFINTINALQVVMDSFRFFMLGPVTIKLLGDINHQLITCSKLRRNWDCEPGLNAHDHILFNLLQAKNLIRPEFVFPHTQKYIFLQYTRKMLTDWLYC